MVKIKELTVLKFNNPILSGFYPDPSIERVGDDYYLVLSSFEYYPGVPIFHSKDLVNWDQIGYVLTDQFNLESRKGSKGIFAPTLRYHDGVFYMITTDTDGIGNFYVTATDPRGPWSEPITIPYGNIDPSLTFIGDTTYVTIQNGEGYGSHIIQYEIDKETGEALTEPVKIFSGDGGQWTEGPHLYKIDSTYYLMCACGGTGEDHREIIARSENPYGPFELYEQPILTHREIREHPIQTIGHADLVDDPDGNWWMVFLGTRPANGKYTLMGRETFLAPVEFTEDGWPYVDNNDGTVQEVMETPQLKVEQKKNSEFFTDFTEHELDVTWTYLRKKRDAYFVFPSRNGWLRLDGRADKLTDEQAHPTILLQRQPSHHFKAETRVYLKGEFEDCEAGLVVWLNEYAHQTIGEKFVDEKRIITVTEVAQHKRIVKEIEVDTDIIDLKVECDGSYYTYSIQPEEGEAQEVAKLSVASLSTEHNGGFGGVFTGVMVGLYATGNGKKAQEKAYFDWFKLTDQSR
ncbi:alpha-N-arabinofuranosidase [Pelagirhabdus alkalitolerans]|uniref:Alpha-N-arabinofuranosidase n=1 Tax=Pelagirhabdus alkalitolerans TaxID=1612202 RepID=A0A1G6KFJ8_9BACI|nr:glycoside hydrolase family 43 protein [Pelagirhabdus alkalitolerans]SDC29601.1 alpha-N-arabinofuranosidase [Pelagirhabdus alkalitolerans]